MKKFLAIVLAAVMVLSMLSFASAESLAGEYEIKVWVADAIVDLTTQQIDRYNQTNEDGIVFKYTIEKMVVLSPGGQLDVADIPDEMRAPAAIPLPIAATGTLAETEKAKILAALQSVGNNRSKAARVLGISRRTLYRKLDEYAKEGVLP